MLFNDLSSALVGALLVFSMAVGQALCVSPKKRIVPRSHTLHERQPEQWAGQWEKRDKVAADVLLPMRIGFKHLNLAAGHDRLMDM